MVFFLILGKYLLMKKKSFGIELNKLKTAVTEESETPKRSLQKKIRI